MKKLSFLPPITDSKAPSGYRVQTLFTDSDGYTVKKFHSEGRWHHYVVRRDEATAINTHSRQTGKHRTTFDENVETR